MSDYDESEADDRSDYANEQDAGDRYDDNDGASPYFEDGSNLLYL